MPNDFAARYPTDGSKRTRLSYCRLKTGNQPFDKINNSEAPTQTDGVRQSGRGEGIAPVTPPTPLDRTETRWAKTGEDKPRPYDTFAKRNLSVNIRFR